MRAKRTFADEISFLKMSSNFYFCQIFPLVCWWLVQKHLRHWIEISPCLFQFSIFLPGDSVEFRIFFGVDGAFLRRLLSTGVRTSSTFFFGVLTAGESNEPLVSRVTSFFEKFGAFSLSICFSSLFFSSSCLKFETAEQESWTSFRHVFETQEH